ncbi:DUF2309 domain-containing protein [Comamonadaceae bacterium G21597-S1]|nr:DUF2309 domain-containing protein [Comamonadaceae bacterium G21597-S1]
MNAPCSPGLLQAQHIAEALALACERIAPSWPLDRLIAVNPYWGRRQQPIATAAAELGLLAGSRLTMPRAWYRSLWQRGQLQATHLQAAADRAGIAPQRLLEALQQDEATLPRLALVADLRDHTDGATPLTWSERVTHQISQHCAAYFDHTQARWRLDNGSGLYASWLEQLAADRGLPWRQARTLAQRHIAALARDPMALIGQTLDGLGLAPEGYSAYLSALLLSINGWASWCAYRQWQARLAGQDDPHLVELLAIRLAWDWLLQQDAPECVDRGWAATWCDADARSAQLAQAQQFDWLLQEASEIAYQQPLCQALVQPPPRRTEAAIAVQAVFCIDVRSEPMRRALEAVDPRLQTRGFAGFFGLPIAYAPAGSALERPQLPGLLAPAMTATEGAADDTRKAAPALGQLLASRRRSALQWRQRWADLRASASSGFSFVETCGLGYAAKLLTAALPSERPTERWEDAGLDDAQRGHRPQLALAGQDASAAADLALPILRAMGLTQDFAPLVMLAGHGSQSANNPHAAGLDCGACGGQTGEVNARVLADLLNRAPVRAALALRGVSIPAATHFVPALHNTTTDDIALFDTNQVPAPLHDRLARLRDTLAAAGCRVRAERAPALGLAALRERPEALARALRRRANDWAEVRPEWGLADNAAFIVAPRARTRHLSLAGRSFLHDYDWREDEGFGVLELIMTAPMVVTNWINLQYHASTVDPQRYGSGDKVLHNTVGGHIGVFEGNGGDLRIGLPWQSVHDGTQLRHTPLRLSVFIEAPRAAIDAIIERHGVVGDLVDNGWLHLLRIDSDGAGIEQRRQGHWSPCTPD